MINSRTIVIDISIAPFFLSVHERPIIGKQAGIVLPRCSHERTLQSIYTFYILRTISEKNEGRCKQFTLTTFFAQSEQQLELIF